MKNKILKIIEKVNPHLEDCKIDKDYLKLPNGFDNISDIDLKIAYIWLKNIPIDDYLSLLSMVPESFRNKLLTMPMFKFHRYRLSVTKAKIDIYKAIRVSKKPILFKKRGRK